MDIKNIDLVREYANKLNILTERKRVLGEKEENLKNDYDLKYYILANIDLIDDEPNTIAAFNIMRNSIAKNINKQIKDIEDEIQKL